MECAPHGGGGTGSSDRFRDEDVGNGHDAEGGGAAAADIPPSEAFRAAATLAGELKEYAGYYLGAKLDAIKLTATNIAVYTILGIVGGFVAVTVVVMAAVMLCTAICNGLGNLFGYLLGPGWAWLGPLLFGLVVLGGIGVGAMYGLKWFARTTRGKLVAKYEDRKRQERHLYGHDVSERARQQRVVERSERG